MSAAFASVLRTCKYIITWMDDLQTVNIITLLVSNAVM